MDDPSGSRTLKISVFSNLGLFFVKGALALSCGSAAMYASTLYSLSNSVNNVLSLLGLKMSSRPADAEHPFGYGKEIYFWSFVASVFMLGFASTGAISQGYNQIAEKQDITTSIWPVIVLSLALVYECFLLKNALNLIAKSFGSSSIKNSLRRFRRYNNPVNKILILQSAAAVIGTVVSLSAMLITRWTGNYLFDGMASIMVGLILGSMALVIAYQLKDMIIGRSCNPATVQLIGDLAMKVPGVMDICDIKTMYMGSQCLLVNMEIQVKCDLNVDKVDDVVNEVEKTVKSNLQTVKHINIETVADDKVQGWNSKNVSQPGSKILEFV